MNICVTGGCGFIGVHLVERLLDNGHQVLVLDNFAVAGPDRLDTHSALEIVGVDVRDRDATLQAIAARPQDAIFHLAALHFIPYCNEHPVETMEVNVSGTRNIVEAALKYGVNRLVLASSAAVYPPQLTACSEEQLPGPVDIYGYSKWMAEMILMQMTAGTPLTATAARLFNVYGPRETNPHVIPHILEQLKTGGPVYLGNLESQRDYIYVLDVIEALIRMLDIPSSGPAVFNIGTGASYSVQEILSTLERLLDREIEVKTRSDLLRKQDRPQLLADCSRSERIIGWSEEFPLEQGMLELLISERLVRRQT